MESLDVLFEGLPAGLKSLKRFCVNCFRLLILRHCAAKILVGKHHGAVHEVSKDGKEFRVVAALEVLPGEVVILGFRGIGGEDITHDVLAARELLLIFIHPHGPVTGSGNLVTFKVEELIGRDVVRKDVRSLGLQH